MEKFKAPKWCKLRYDSVKDAMLGAAEIYGAKIFQSVSFVFRIDDFLKLQKCVKKYGKEPIVEQIMKFVEKNNA
jgi:hypothetical protein